MLSARQKQGIELAALLCQVAYRLFPYVGHIGKSVSEILQAASETAGDFVLANGMENSTLFRDTVMLTQSDAEGVYGLQAYAFFQPTQNTVYFVYRGTGDGNWLDNGEGMYKTKSLRQKQAVQFFERVLRSRGWNRHKTASVAVTGHSKGGNLAQFVTLGSAYSGLLDACYSFNGQGFSKASMDFFRTVQGINYGKQAQKIIAINGAKDYVNGLGVQAVPPQNIYYTETVSGDSFKGWHELEGFFENGSFRFCFTSQGDLGKFAAKLSACIMDLPVEKLSACAMTVTAVAELWEGKKFGEGDRKTASPRELIGFVAVGVPIFLAEAVRTDVGRRAVFEILDAAAKQAGIVQSAAAFLTAVLLLPPGILIWVLCVLLDRWLDA